MGLRQMDSLADLEELHRKLHHFIYQLQISTGHLGYRIRSRSGCFVGPGGLRPAFQFLSTAWRT